MKNILLAIIPLLALTSCNKGNTLSTIDYVSGCVLADFQLKYSECEVITFSTQEIPTSIIYYITDIYYRHLFENNVYESKYISAFNDKNELVFKEIKYELL